MEGVEWRFEAFEALRPADVYGIAALRQAVFIVEQNCAFQDLDGLDKVSAHLFASQRQEITACLRLVPPGVSFAEPSLGRIVTATSQRGTGLGKELMRRGIDICEARYPGEAIRINAQQYLERFYQGFGFQTVSEVYLEDGILHVEMLRPRP